MSIQTKTITQRISEWAIRYNWMVFAVMLVIHFVVQDRFWGISLLFYGMPLPVMMGFCGVCLYTYRRIPFARYVLGVLLSVLSIVWLSSSYKIHAVSAPPENSFKVLFWNSARPDTHPLSTLIEHLQATPADIMGFVESGSISEEALSAYQSAFPAYRIQRLSGGMLCMTMGIIHTVTYHRLSHESCYNILEIELNNTLYTIVIVDIGANPVFPRRASLHALIEELPNREHMIVMGDFNTPYESVFFQTYKRRYHHAFHEAGSGFAATWPYGIPLLQLDHIWMSRGIRPVSVMKYYAILSDHARLEAILEPI
jgi:endonuclease/exonuclease/phosphatase (EEP) superfamily protein YafD